jgi:uncharacterized protein YegJ (DUF2314 family)
MSLSLLHTSTARWLLFLSLMALVAPARAGDKSPKASAPAATAFPRSQLYSPEVSYAVLLLHPSPPKADLEASARKLLTSKYKVLNSARSPDAPGSETMVQALPPEESEPMDEKLLDYFGRGLDAQERKRLLGARHATLLAFRAPFAQRHEVLLASTRFAHQLASEHGAFLYDTETREYFSAKSWKEARLEGWSGGVPTTPAHLTLHVYPTGERLRIISLGMAKLGLPDLVVEQVPQALAEDMGQLVNGVAQLLAEGLVPSAEGALEVDLTKVKDTKVRSRLEPHAKEGVRRRTTLRAQVARPDEGDPENALLELAFPGTGTLHARQLAALDALFGPQPANMASAPAEDPELEQVARKARARLAELKPRVEKGLKPPELLLLKARFRTDDGNIEQMWLEVTSLSKSRWRGTLANEPQFVSGLRRGATVEVPEAEVTDYLYMSPDGKREGGESSTILMRRQGH